MILVVDASVALKWAVLEEGSKEAVALLQSGYELLAPDLITAEIANVIWRMFRQGVVQKEQAEFLLNAGLGAFRERHPLSPLAIRAAGIAMDLGHPAYDCFYLALAEIRGALLSLLIDGYWRP